MLSPSSLRRRRPTPESSARSQANAYDGKVHQRSGCRLRNLSRPSHSVRPTRTTCFSQVNITSRSSKHREGSETSETESRAHTRQVKEERNLQRKENEKWYSDAMALTYKSPFSPELKKAIDYVLGARREDLPTILLSPPAVRAMVIDFERHLPRIEPRWQNDHAMCSRCAYYVEAILRGVLSGEYCLVPVSPEVFLPIELNNLETQCRSQVDRKNMLDWPLAFVPFIPQLRSLLSRRNTVKSTMQVSQLFKLAAGFGARVLRWSLGDVQRFGRSFFIDNDLPAPQCPDEVWYQLFRECENHSTASLDFAEAVNFGHHLLQRVFTLVSFRNAGIYWSRDNRSATRPHSLDPFCMRKALRSQEKELIQSADHQEYVEAQQHDESLPVESLVKVSADVGKVHSSLHHLELDFHINQCAAFQSAVEGFAKTTNELIMNRVAGADKDVSTCELAGLCELASVFELPSTGPMSLCKWPGSENQSELPHHVESKCQTLQQESTLGDVGPVARQIDFADNHTRVRSPKSDNCGGLRDSLNEFIASFCDGRSGHMTESSAIALLPSQPKGRDVSCFGNVEVPNTADHDRIGKRSFDREATSSSDICAYRTGQSHQHLNRRDDSEIFATVSEYPGGLGIRESVPNQSQVPDHSESAQVTDRREASSTVKQWTTQDMKKVGGDRSISRVDFMSAPDAPKETQPPSEEFESSQLVSVVEVRRPDTCPDLKSIELARIEASSNVVASCACDSAGDVLKQAGISAKCRAIHVAAVPFVCTVACAVVRRYPGPPRRSSKYSEQSANDLECKLAITTLAPLDSDSCIVKADEAPRHDEQMPIHSITISCEQQVQKLLIDASASERGDHVFQVVEDFASFTQTAHSSAHCLADEELPTAILSVHSASHLLTDCPTNSSGEGFKITELPTRPLEKLDIALIKHLELPRHVQEAVGSAAPAPSKLLAHNSAQYESLLSDIRSEFDRHVSHCIEFQRTWAEIDEQMRLRIRNLIPEVASSHATASTHDTSDIQNTRKSSVRSSGRRHAVDIDLVDDGECRLEYMPEVCVSDCDLLAEVALDSHVQPPHLKQQGPECFAIDTPLTSEVLAVSHHTEDLSACANTSGRFSAEWFAIDTPPQDTKASLAESTASSRARDDDTPFFGNLLCRLQELESEVDKIHHEELSPANRRLRRLLAEGSSDEGTLPIVATPSQLSKCPLSWTPPPVEVRRSEKCARM